ncbi:uncharacterized protein [Physeter macrocephalus]|uniref:Uncharacterized protein isoform X2 n=1 Tax=Physeter macrocephalus TaxID=9755 RepID=A0A9W2X7B4_PHYMC|nr:uncharacterized protein LOC114487924 isoform X2 [Physeter catodon]
MRSSASRLSSFSSRDSLWNRMPDQISVSEFIAETTEDYNSPTTSSFTTRLHNCRNTVTLLEEVPWHAYPDPHRGTIVGFPGGAVVKNPPAIARVHVEPWFEPRSRKIPHAAEQLSPRATTTEPVL